MSATDRDGGAHPALADLEVLQRRGALAAPPPRPLLPRLLLALLALGGLAALYGAFVGPLLFPPREVRLAPVREVKGGTESARRTLATAAGWLEAEPYPVTVRPLVAGVVERIEVLEGQTVKRGETVIAVLRNVDLETALEEAQALAAARGAAVTLAEARLARSQALLGQKIALRAALLAAELASRSAAESVQEARAELAHSEAEVEQSGIELEAQQVLKGSGGTPPISLRVAESAHRQNQAHRDVARAALARAEAEAEVRARELALAQEALDDPRGLAQDVAVAAEEAAAAKADQSAAATAVRIARAKVDLLTVRAPSDGVVQRLLAAPGAPAGPDAFTAREALTVGPGSTGALDTAMGGIALLYDPAHLQARVEVPVADVGAVGLDREVALEVDVVPGRTFRGTVLRLVGEANIQNNKLWVKVRLVESDPLLRPEMLCRARFLAPAVPEGAAGAASGRPRLEVPTAAVLRGHHDDGVFVLDPTGGGRARRVAVVRGGERDGFVEVEGALGLSNEVILDPQGLEDGTKVRAVR